jgi:hypothetical protein
MGLKDKLKNRKVDLKAKQPKLNILIYGQSGVGKTILSATASKLDGNTFLISSESGLVGVSNKKFKDQIDTEKITAYAIDNFIDFNEYYEFLSEHCELVMQYDAATGEAKEKLADKIWELEDGGKRPKGKKPTIYRTVVIDSLTEAQKRSMDRIIDSKNKVKSGGSFGGGIDFEKATATLQDYGVNTQQMRKLVRAFRELPMNIIFIALESELKDDVTGEVTVGPALTAKLSSDVVTYVDIIGRLYTQKNQDGKLDRKLLLQPYSKYIAKDRTGLLGIGLTNPTIKTIVDKINEGGN